ncbi:MAG: hypothetical protein RMY36_020515 [Nostoc sp. SerVER01]|nr:hypothetical protein [Nostoc sp. SerVER01]
MKNDCDKGLLKAAFGVTKAAFEVAKATFEVAKAAFGVAKATFEIRNYYTGDARTAKNETNTFFSHSLCF